jgi:hypothetical protein
MVRQGKAGQATRRRWTLVGQAAADRARRDPIRQAAVWREDYFRKAWVVLIVGVPAGRKIPKNPAPDLIVRESISESIARHEQPRKNRAP